MKKNLLTIALKWGFLLGLTLAGCEIVKMLSRDINYSAGPVFSILLLIVLVLFQYAAVKEYRDDIQEGFIRFPKAFGSAALVVLVASFLMIAYMMAHYTYLDKKGLERLNQQNVDKFYAKLEKENVPADEIVDYLDYSDSLTRSTFGSMLNEGIISDSCKLCVETRLNALLKAYKDRVLLRSQVDTVHYTYTKFQEYAQLCFMDVYQNQLSSADFDAASDCNRPMSMLVNNAHYAMQQFNLVQQAFEKNKSKIPHYTSVFPVALSYAFSVLLYGLFVAIFVALYLTKKSDDDKKLPKIE